MTESEPTANPPEPIPQAVVDLVRDAEWITVFTGAGMSAESGIATFRDADTGLWERFDPATLATPEAWADDPALVWGWYSWRARRVRAAEPNAGHQALADLARDRVVMIVTQNVDDLHERAGSQVVSHLHGSLFAPRCSRCGRPYPGDTDLDSDTLDGRVTPPVCPYCGGDVRPGIVWFGEALPTEQWERAEQAIRGSDLVLVIGTSGIVYPAASLPEHAARAGVPVIEFNPEPSALSSIARHRVPVTAATGLPELVRALGDGDPPAG